MSNYIDDFWDAVAVQQTRAGTGVSVKTERYKQYEQGEVSLSDLEQPSKVKQYKQYDEYNHEEYIKANKRK